MATSPIINNARWETLHQNGLHRTKILYDTMPESRHRIPDHIERYNDCANHVRSLLQEAVDNKKGFRAYGSSWSLNHIPHHQDRMQHNTQMNIKIDIAQQDMHAQSPYDHSDLFLFQCGNLIKWISNYLFDKNRSLKASGASNGQTIAGVMSTGVHGSAFDTGAVHDSIVGINLIIGPKPTDVVYLERHTRPALNDAFAAKIKARVIRNDGLFNAALVGLGSFGFIHGVVIETEELYLLKRYIEKIPKAQAIELAENMNFEQSQFSVPGEVDANGNPLRPYHYKLYVNPYRPNDAEYITEIIYKKPYQPGYPNPIPTIRTSLNRELLETLIWIASHCNNSIPKVIKFLGDRVFPSLDADITGTLGEIFWDAQHKGKAFAITMGIDHTQTSAALNLFTNFINTHGPVPGAIAIRFVKASEATLAFTKFPVTCVLEMDGLQWRKTNNLISMDEFYEKLLIEFKNSGINFTIHWGKNTNWKHNGLVDHMYGAKKDEWMNYRTALLTQEMTEVFSNNFLRDVGLHTHVTGVSNLLVASMDINGNIV